MKGLHIDCTGRDRGDGNTSGHQKRVLLTATRRASLSLPKTPAMTSAPVVRCLTASKLSKLDVLHASRASVEPGASWMPPPPSERRVLTVLPPQSMVAVWFPVNLAAAGDRPPVNSVVLYLSCTVLTRSPPLVASHAGGGSAQLDMAAAHG